MYSKYIKAVISAFTLLLLLSCNEEFEVNSSYFSTINNTSKTIVYRGEKAGDFKEVNQHIAWEMVENLVVEGHINQRDLYQIRNYARPINSAIKNLDFKNADILEGIFPTSLFYENEQLERFVYPRSIMHTGNLILNNCTNIHQIIIPEKVDILGHGVFDEISNLYNKKTPMSKEKYAIPNMVKELGNGCFSNYPYPTISIPNSVEKIGISCFLNSQLVSFTFPPKVSSVSNALFSGSKRLKTVKMHANITRIEEHAFSQTGIQTLQMPTSIKTVGKSFISETPQLKTIQWSPNITALGEEALAYIYLEEFRVPKNITRLGRHCFFGAKTKRYYFHKNITHLGEGIFNFLIKETKTPYAFIEELHVQWQTPPAVGKAFQVSIDFKMVPILNGAPDFSTVTLYVPKGTKNAYQQAKDWKKFKKIIEE
ncbi:MAG: hypothetical protein COB98_10995 [Flavobacteriaceae bacterium]|nr:MAG: hypothetical protein COB98_10995 [Flavobacteriaceae bacterium]